jgi:phenylacetate-CoA ligase
MKLMDTLRGAYVRSPRFVRNLLAPAVALVPTSFKFGRTYRMWRERISRAAADPQLADAEQLASLRALLAKAYAGSPFYREIIANAFGPAFDAANLELGDLRRLPVLGKCELRAAGDDALAVPRWLVDPGETAGSNAEKPLSFHLDKDRSGREMAFVYDAWSRIGYGEGVARAAFRGFSLQDDGARIHEWDPALRELRLSVFPLTVEDAATYMDLIDARRIQYFYGYPSAIELFCRHLRRLGRTPRLPIKGILPISEPIFDHQRAFIRDVLGNPSFACFYGLSEKVLFATEVPGEDGVYEFNPLYGLAELVDIKGEQVTEPGREGRLIGTGFLSTGMPFIRYDTGDFARLVAMPTPANGQRLRVSHLAPRRKPQYLIAADGERVVATALTSQDERFFKGIAEFQLYQDAPGKVLIRYIPAPDGSADDIARFVNDLHVRSQGRLSYAAEPVCRIATGRDGKRAFIDQRLDMTRY